jgi:hypothetical protein
MQFVQVHQPPWGLKDWKTLDLPADLLQKILTLAEDEKIQIPDVGGWRLFILNKAWRDFSMHQKRENGGKRGVRIFTLPDPPSAVLPPSVDLDVGPGFPSISAPCLNHAQVSAPPECPRVPTGRSRTRALCARSPRVCATHPAHFPSAALALCGRWSTRPRCAARARRAVRSASSSPAS